MKPLWKIEHFACPNEGNVPRFSPKVFDREYGGVYLCFSCLSIGLWWFVCLLKALTLANHEVHDLTRPNVIAHNVWPCKVMDFILGMHVYLLEPQFWVVGSFFARIDDFQTSTSCKTFSTVFLFNLNSIRDTDPSKPFLTEGLLFISHKFVKRFLAITFLLLVIFGWNFHDACQRQRISP